MSEPIQIKVTAETQAAAAALRAFCQDGSTGLKMLQGAGTGVRGELTEMRHSAMALHEGFRTLELGVYVLAGQRFPELGEGVMAARSAMMLTRTVAILTGASMAVVGTAIAALTVALLPTAVYWWKAHKAAEEEARTEAELHEQVLERQKRLMEQVNDLQAKGVLDKTDVILMQQAAREARIANPDDPSAGVRAGEQFLMGRGLTKPAVEGLEEFGKLQQKIHEESLVGFEGERTKAKEVADQKIAELEEYAAKAGSLIDPNQLALQRQHVYENLNVTLKGIDTKENAKTLADEQKALQTSLLMMELSFGDQRVGAAKKEYDMKIEAMKSWKAAGLITSEEFNAMELEAEKARIDGVKTENEALEKQIELRRENARADLEAIQNNPFLSDQDKADQSIPILQKQLALQKEMDIQKGIVGLTREQAQLQNQIASAKGQTSVTYQFGTVIAQIKSLNNLARESAQSFQNVFNSAISSISSGITGVIEGTKTWRQALKEIGASILNEVITAIVQMGVRWILTQILMSVGGKAILAAAVAETAPIAAAQSLIWATPATLATIASYGGAAVAAPGLIAFANAMTMMQAVTGGFAEGGYTGDGGKYDVAGLVHRGEFVVPADAVSRIGVPHLESMVASGAPAASGGGGGGGTIVHKHVHVWNRQSWLNEMKKNDAGKIFTHHVFSNPRASGV